MDHLNSGSDFESDVWFSTRSTINNQTNSSESSPTLSPIYSVNKKRIATTGIPVCDEIVYGVHYTDQSYPSWNGLDDSNIDDELSDSLPSTPSSFMQEKKDFQRESTQFLNTPPFSMAEIASMANDVRKILGFQHDTCISGFELLMSQLDSRSSRMPPKRALKTLHSEYISGKGANFRKWYFAAQMDHIEAVQGGSKVDAKDRTDTGNVDGMSLAQSEAYWDHKMETCGDACRMADLMIYLFCWTESNQIRFMPECLAFIVKCAMDYYYHVVPQLGTGNDPPPLPEMFFLDHIITPLYNCYLANNYMQTESGNWIRREGDHNNFIGYDDMNQLFWYKQGLSKIKVNTGNSNGQLENVSITELPSSQWYFHLPHVDWFPAFSKTYRESRTWLHLVTNFSRSWILHLSVFWFYTSFNSPSMYTVSFNYMNPQSPPTFVKYSIMSFGGLFGPVISLIGLIGEFRFVPRKFPGAQSLWPRVLMVCILIIIQSVPAVCLLSFNSWDYIGHGSETMSLDIIAVILFVVSMLSALYFSIVPLNSLVENRSSTTIDEKKKRQTLANQYFTANFPKLRTKDHILSWVMWILIFVSKFIESYFFLTLSVRDPIRELDILKLDDMSAMETTFSRLFVACFPKLILVVLILAEMTLFFLDTYLWYVIYNTLISVIIALKGGTSIWKPWSNIFSSLPQRISAKLLAPAIQTNDQKSKKLSLGIIWNSIVESLYLENYLSQDVAKRLTLLNALTEDPRFFTVEEDSKAFKSNNSKTGAYRRISFFAQSLSTPMQPAVKIERMPSFTVLVPHYKEKMILSLNETIKASNNSKVTVIEYLKHLYPVEWENFVKETERKYQKEQQQLGSQQMDVNSAIFHKLALQNLGFSSYDPNYTMATRLWCSKRSQTLYRTVHGFSNYFDAIGVLYYAEGGANKIVDKETQQRVTNEVFDLSQRKFRLLVSLQLYAKFTDEELKEVEMMLQVIPNLNISYIDYDPFTCSYFACLFDQSCALMENGRRAPKLRIKLSGNPILGDGKSDNQNIALPFYRGEYIQVVDANQDNYLEECLKIRNVLQEFESDTFESAGATCGAGVSPVGTAMGGTAMGGTGTGIGICMGALPLVDHVHTEVSPIAIVGAREYIFSENIGVLGDVAAGKEQTFGTLFARTLAQIGAKLHYGHPDFLNAIFMTTRGGVSKGQRGLHLNEDIYAGMTAMLRGGRIRHSEYFQCGKGRDLGFVSILNFITKIGAGMGEQVLSREYFYLGTQLPFDRFSSFYFAHPGFHLNNTFITVSIELLQFFMLLICSLASVSTLCELKPTTLPTDLHQPTGCKNIMPLILWLRRCVISIFSVFFVSLCPLIFQELIERGFLRSCQRILRHLSSLSMLFEMFVCRVYTRSFWEDLNLGGARYVSTGRDFATSRFPFWKLYEGYSVEILTGVKSLGILVFCSCVLFDASYIWFWVTTFSAVICPVLYNPHQFAVPAFFRDYSALMHWFFSQVTESDHDNSPNANAVNSWYDYTRSNREKITGTKRRETACDYTRPNLRNTMFLRLGSSIFAILMFWVPYLVCTTEGKIDNLVFVMCKLGVASLFPSLANGTVLFILSFVSFACGRLSKSVGPTVSKIAHVSAIVVMTVTWYLIYILERAKVLNSILLLAGGLAFNSFIDTFCIIFVIRKQPTSKLTNEPWWNGDWLCKQLGWKLPIVVLKEWIAKTVESHKFACDFLTCHIILILQIPLLIIPFMDSAHTLFLLWMKPQRAREGPHKPKRGYLLLVLWFAVSVLSLFGAWTLPLYLPHSVKSLIVEFTETFIEPLF